MKVLATFLAPSSVVDSVKCQLGPQSQLEHLVVAKPHRIDVFGIFPEGLKHQCGLDILGRVLHVRSLPIEDSELSNIVVMTDSPDPELIFLAYDGQALKVTKKLSLFEHNQREAEECLDVLVYPSGEFMVVSFWAGKVKLIQLENGRYKSDVDASVPELFILAMCLIDSSDVEEGPALVILYADSHQQLQLVARDIDGSTLDLSSAPSTLLPATSLLDSNFPEPTALTLIPVSPFAASPMGGVLIIGGRKIVYFEMATPDAQNKQRKKMERTEWQKEAGDAKNATLAAKDTAKKARAKEKERENKKRKHKGAVEWPWSSVVAWSQPDLSSPRYVFGDEFGRLSMLLLENLEKDGLVLIPLGEVSPPTTLTHLSKGIFYLGSHAGSTQLIEIHTQPVFKLELPTLTIASDVATVSSTSDKVKGKAKATNQDASMGDGNHATHGSVVKTMGSYVSVRETIKNMGSIIEAALVDLDGSGQRQIITCSGDKGSGALNLIRNGAQYDELATMDGISDIVNVWSLKSTFDDPVDSLIAVSTLKETHVFYVDGPNLERTDGKFVLNEPTLAMANVKARRIDKNQPIDKRASIYESGGLVVQVTTSRVVMLESDSFVGGSFIKKAEWVPPHGRTIVAASVTSISASQVVLALSGASLIILNWDSDADLRSYFSHVEASVGDRNSVTNEISAVACATLVPANNFATVVLVSFWGSNTVKVYDVHALKVNPKAPVPSVISPSFPALPTSLALRNFSLNDKDKGGEHRHPYLIVGLSDGSVRYFKYTSYKGPKTVLAELTEEKMFALGDAPVNLACIDSDKWHGVLASGSRASIFFWDGKRLRQSTIMLKDVVSATNFNGAHLKNALILATSTGFTIGTVQDLDKMHIRSILLGLDSPKHIQHIPSPRKVFGVSCLRTEPARVGEEPVQRSSFRLLDDATFNHLSQYTCDADEEIASIHTILVEDERYFCVATLMYDPDELEPSAGRLLVFSTHAGDTVGLSLVGSKGLGGCPYAMTDLHGFLAIAVNTAVVLFRITKKDATLPGLTIELVDTWSHNYIVTSLTSKGDNLMLGDAIASVSLLKLEPSIPKLKTVARDYAPLWPNAVQALDDQHIICSNAEFNVFTFELQNSNNRLSLGRDGAFHMGDLVNGFIPGSLLAPDSIDKDAPFKPEQLFYTSSGRIGVVLDVEKEIALKLSSLQRNMAAFFDNGHTKFRAPKNSKGRSDADGAAFGFLDGDFLESYLSIPEEDVQVMEAISMGSSDAEKLEQTDAEIRKVLELLQGLH